MQKPLSDGFSREIFAVFRGEKGERREQDFDILPEKEKKWLQIQTNRRALRAAGYAPIGEKLRREKLSQKRESMTKNRNGSMDLSD